MSKAPSGLSPSWIPLSQLARVSVSVFSKTGPRDVLLGMPSAADSTSTPTTATKTPAVEGAAPESSPAKAETIDSNNTGGDEGLVAAAPSPTTNVKTSMKSNKGKKKKKNKKAKSKSAKA